MSNNGFLPEDYEIPKAGGNYLKLQKGENRFRILSKPIMGYEDWEDKKPIRFPMNKKPARPINPAQAVKHFWCMVVWNVIEKKVQLLEITQSTIMSAIRNLSQDDDWGDPFKYDIKVSKTGDGMETEYAVSPAPHSPVSEEAKKALKDKGKINLNALFENGDPFESSPDEKTNGKIQPNRAAEMASESIEEGDGLPF